MDASYPFHDPSEAEHFGNAVKQVYMHLDRALGDLIETTQPETVLVLSDHGFGFNQRGAEYLRPWLAELGLLKQRTSGHASRGLLSGAYRWVDRLLDRETKLRLARLLPGLRARVEATIQLGDIDWGNTQAYCTGATDDVYINLNGREPQGIVDPGGAYEELCTTLIEHLQKTANPATGQPAVEFVARREEVYHGPHIERAPDILIRWSTQSVLAGLHTPGHAPIPSQPLPPPTQSGGHRLYGVLIAAGDCFRQKASWQETSIMDVAPTILHLFGTPIPKNIDGQVMSFALDANWSSSHPVQFAEPTTPSGENVPEDYSAEEAADIEERLRGMGYIE
jgi:predicted AlkP superfamily phosphohydrolase/phosphomutase